MRKFIPKKTIEENHREAMLIADDADQARKKMKALYHLAFLYEKEAALSVKDMLWMEPTRSVLFRSAASLAIDCEEYEQAMEMIKIGLEGKPPSEIKEELEELKSKIKETNNERKGKRISSSGM